MVYLLCLRIAGVLGQVGGSVRPGTGEGVSGSWWSYSGRTSNSRERQRRKEHRRAGRDCTSLQSTTDYFENENNNISWQKIDKFLLTISKDAYEEIGLGTFQLWQLPLNIELYNAVFFLIQFYFHKPVYITMVKTINYIKSHLCKISVSIWTAIYVCVYFVVFSYVSLHYSSKFQANTCI